MPIEPLDDKLRKIAKELGADLYGVADIAPAQETIIAQGGPVVASYPRAISIGIRLLDSIVDQLPRRTERAVATSYHHYCCDVMNQRQDHLTSRLSSELQNHGFSVIPIAASRRNIDDERICGPFSHKLAAGLAGLGWIGKSCLLVTPQYGPRVRWATVLTNAPLEVTGHQMEVRCGDCQQCVAICPAQAFTGRSFRSHEPREARFDACACDSYIKSLGESAEMRVCGLCLYVCPYGRHRTEV